MGIINNLPVILEQTSDDLIKIVNNAILIAAEEKKEKRTSNINMTIDIKDNLHEPLKAYAEENGFEYHRSNLSQYFIIEGRKIKLKFHNSLNKEKKEIVEQENHKQLNLQFSNLKTQINEFTSELEIGIETNAKRTSLKFLRFADFNNGLVETIYRHNCNIIDLGTTKNTDSENTDNLKNKITKKQTQEKQETQMKKKVEEIENVI